MEKCLPVLSRKRKTITWYRYLHMMETNQIFRKRRRPGVKYDANIGLYPKHGRSTLLSLNVINANDVVTPVLKVMVLVFVMMLHLQFLNSYIIPNTYRRSYRYHKSPKIIPNRSPFVSNIVKHITTTTSSSTSTNTIRTILSETNRKRSQNEEIKNSNTKNTRQGKSPTKKSHTRKTTFTSTSTTTAKTKLLNPNGPLQTWRVYGIEVHPDRLVDITETVTLNTINEMEIQQNGAAVVVDSDTTVSTTPTINIHPAIIEALQQRLNLQSSTILLSSILTSIQIIRRSVDARCRQRRSDQSFGPRYIYVMDIQINTEIMKQYQIRPFSHQPGRMELLVLSSSSSSSSLPVSVATTPNTVVTFDQSMGTKTKPRVIIVGAGPAGLFCALQLAKTGFVIPIVLERGQPVETRGKDIGALIHRKSLNTESNFAFGEGGAGTWSDGKLTTRIGRNSDMVRKVLETLVQYGAPSNILIEGAPHLGTDNLVRLLRNMRRDLRQMGGIIQFGTKVTGLIIENNVTIGVKYDVNRESTERNIEIAGSDVFNESGIVMGDAVVLATGHSARDVYEQLHAVGVSLEAKGFAVGFRVEHPQKIINKIQYGQEWGPSVITGKGTTDTANANYFSNLIQDDRDQIFDVKHHRGTLPVPSYRLATDKANDGKSFRGVYSFCMCPGGQIVPASTESNEVCVNGMSFSRRDSPYANSALVVTVDPDDEVLEPYRSQFGVLAGIAFQRDMERRAALMGGGKFVVPVQRVTDFLSNTASTSAPPSSYRLGVKPAPCHLIYPEPLVRSMKHALLEHFNRQMPGFICKDGLLHGVETRTSSPVRIVRDGETFQAIGTKNLFPAGEGAGFAGGIVSAAVDGIAVADAILSKKFGYQNGSETSHGSLKVSTTY